MGGDWEKRLPAGDYVRAVRPPPAGWPPSSRWKLIGSYAVLIDGGFARYALKPTKKSPPISDAEVSQLVEAIRNLSCLQKMRLHRVYWYDAKPLAGIVIGPSGPIDFSSSTMSKTSASQHANISKMPYMAMRFGELQHRGWRLRDVAAKRAVRAAAKGEAIKIQNSDLQPNVQQKGVDMRIGLDMATLALKRQVSAIVLVTGDSDLIPAMKLARREGLQVVLVHLGLGIKEPMQDHSDIVVSEPAASFCPVGMDEFQDASGSVTD